MTASRRPETAPARGFGWEKGTMRKAALLGGALALLVALGAWWGAAPTAEGPLASYLKHGATAGAAALQRDLAAQFPPGAPLPPLVLRLEALGMRCAPPPVGSPDWHCDSQLRGEGRKLLHAEVVIASEGNRVAALQARFVNTAP